MTFKNIVLASLAAAVGIIAANAAMAAGSKLYHTIANQGGN